MGYAGFDIAALMAFFGAIGVLGVGSTLFTIRAHMRSDTGHYSINSNNNGAGGIQRSEYMQIPCANDGDNDEEDDRNVNEGGDNHHFIHNKEPQEERNRNGLISENNTFIQPKLSPVSTISPLSSSLFSSNVNHRGDKYVIESKCPVKKSSIDESLTREKV